MGDVKTKNKFTGQIRKEGDSNQRKITACEKALWSEGALSVPNYSFGWIYTNYPTHHLFFVKL